MLTFCGRKVGNGRGCGLCHASTLYFKFQSADYCFLPYSMKNERPNFLGFRPLFLSISSFIRFILMARVLMIWRPLSKHNAPTQENLFPVHRKNLSALASSKKMNTIWAQQVATILNQGKSISWLEKPSPSHSRLPFFCSA
jgi:hypothetical protein